MQNIRELATDILTTNIQPDLHSADALVLIAKPANNISHLTILFISLATSRDGERQFTTSQGGDREHEQFCRLLAL